MEELERRVMAMFLSGDLPVLETLRTEYAQAAVTEREFTGVGVFTHFSVPPDLERTRPRGFQLTDLDCELDGVEHGVGAVLFVTDGLLDVLEFFTYDDEWPQQVVVRSISYLATHGPTPSRDLDELRRAIEEAQRRESAA